MPIGFTSDLFVEQVRVSTIVCVETTYRNLQDNTGERTFARAGHRGVRDMKVADSVECRPIESIRAYLYAGDQVAPAVLPPVPFARESTKTGGKDRRRYQEDTSELPFHVAHPAHG